MNSYWRDSNAWSLEVLQSVIENQPLLGLAILLTKVTVVLGTAWAFHIAIGRNKPVWRRLIWRMTSVGLLLLILLSLFPPMISLPILPVGDSAQASSITDDDFDVLASPVCKDDRELFFEEEVETNSTLPMASLDQPVETTIDYSSGIERANTNQPVSNSEFDVAEDLEISVGDIEAPLAERMIFESEHDETTIGQVEASAAIVRKSWPASSVVALIWSVGFLLALIRSAVGVCFLNQLQRKATVAPERIQNLTGKIVRQLGLKIVPTVFIVDRIETPCLTGLFRSVILLPRDICEPTEARADLDCVIAHECAHMERSDLFWNAILNGLTAAFWFHPLIWRSRLAHADACDSVVDSRVAGFFGSHDRYCRTLASLALRAHLSAPSLSLGMARKSTVRKRIEQLRSGLPVIKISTERVVLFVALSLCAALLLGGLTISGIVAAPVLPIQSLSFQDEDLTDVTEVRCVGRVTSDDGSAIADAKVVLVLPGGGDGNLTSLFEFDPLTTRTDTEGRFEFVFDQNDNRFRKQGLFKLLIGAQGHALTVRTADLNRLMVRLPFNVQLKPAQPFQFELVDHGGRPISKATIHPARVNSTRIPIGVLPEFKVVTDESGRATWDQLDPTSLNQVYAQTELHGNQQLQFVKTGDGWRASALPEGNVEFKTNFPANWERKKAHGKQLLVATIPSRTKDHDGPDTLSWRTIEFDEHGNLPAISLATGHVRYFGVGDGFELVEDRQEFFLPKLKHQQNASLDLNYIFDTRTEFTFQVVDDAGKPLPNISFGKNFTDANGKFIIKFDKNAPPSGQIFPVDPTGIHFTPAVGFKYARTSDNDKVYQTFVMPRTSAIKGIAVDESGVRVAGAVIEYEYGELRFERSGQTVSGESGEFQLRGIPNGTAVSIKAHKGSLGTGGEQEIQFVAGQTSELELLLLEQPFAKIAGRIVDADNRPIKDAVVRIWKASVFIKEGFNGESLDSQRLFDDLTVFTDEKGRFDFPKTRDVNCRYRIEVAKDQFYDLKSRFVGGSEPIENGRVNLGDFTLLKKPEMGTRTLRVVDWTGEPMPNVEVTFLSYRGGRKRFTTGSKGMVKADLPSTGQLLSLHSSDGRNHIQWLEPSPEEQTVRFLKESEVNSPVSPRHRKPETYDILAAALLNEIETPGTEATYHRQREYFRARSLVDFAGFRKFILDPACPYKYRREFWSSASYLEFAYEPSTAVERLKESNQEALVKAHRFCGYAMQSDDSGLREDLFAEAVSELRDLNGIEKWRTMSFVAECLVFSGHAEDAADLLKSIWGSELTVEKVKALPRHVRRNILPVMAIIDPETVLELIGTTSSKLSAREWIPQSLVWLATADFEKYKSLDKNRFNADLAFGIRLNLRSFKRVLLDRQPMLRLAKNLYEESGPESVRPELLLAVARQAEGLEERKKWIHATVERGVVANERTLCELACFEEVLSAEIDQLIHSAIGQASEKFATSWQIEGFGNLAALIAFKDPQLARKLLEPVFEDLNWLHDYSKGLNFIRNYPLRSTLWIDPRWTKSLAGKLVNEYESDHPTMKIETCGALIQDACFISRLIKVDQKRTDQIKVPGE